MRNPIRWKNLRPRFLPYIAIGLLIAVLHRPSRGALALGLPLVLAGAVLRGWAAGHLVKNDALATTGPYAHLRHPLYLGTLLVATGFGVSLGGLIAGALLAGIWPWFGLHYFPRKDRTEAARLAALHGEAFERYRAAVPALWPRWRAWRDGGSDVVWRLERYSDNNELGTLLAIATGIGFLTWRAAGGSP
jgi:protein-S-isoprenylcysteine O-methyltransferase Ste14